MTSTVQTNAPSTRVDVLAIMRSKIPTATNKLSNEMLVPDFAYYWLNYLTPEIKDSTRDSYKSALDSHIERVFYKTRLCDLTSEDVQFFVMSLVEGVDLEDPLSAKTIRNVHGVLHRCLETACTMKLIGENPSKHTMMPKVPKVEIIPLNTEQINALPGLLSLSFPRFNGETLLHRLDLKGICVSTGSACNGSNDELSHVLQAIHLNEKNAHGTIRISLGRNNTDEDVLIIVRSLCEIIN